MLPTKQTKITDHVRVHRKRLGRPKKKSQSGAAAARGSNSSSASANAASAGQRKKSPTKPHGEQRKTTTNYADPEALARMTSAVQGWDALVESGLPHLKKTDFAKQRGIKPSTFRKYVCGQRGDPKRRKLGAASGKKTLLADDEMQLLVDTIRRRDRGNEGMSTSDAIDAVRTLKPELSHKQAENQVHNALKRKHSDVLTKRMVVPQATTTKRSQINAAQQYRWHMLIEVAALGFMRAENTGVCRVARRAGRAGDRQGREAATGCARRVERGHCGRRPHHPCLGGPHGYRRRARQGGGVRGGQGR